ncbi:hypothetical protein TREMEDRAFT_27804 [Tremella mesenterica DSM 1558]|uniref:uncharacterized protein n=1 Tax=Tremella mesenterica (strain ATCC 24925 / CBS 8224 / DSM 1558 / NBRC 9311 / NRRL Y-6157 / RJB 2259-6 / UBC 559-6) TaxID=578456 RepID=UPI0003F48FDC|nr:uncharacterized protein TREMEDRAFT_27804 [Tremella mesenterica DSM 1558]EIW71381.1 hypothetical protein TREMEDRAFT_27804 [Tremella mesenterica DSM 1558]
MNNPKRPVAIQSGGNGVTGTPGDDSTVEDDSTLEKFLSKQRREFLKDLDDGKGDQWQVVMGNEAGDLDSLASSISYAYLSSTFFSRSTIPLVLTAPEHMSLRLENLHALQLASLSPSVLLHSSQLPCPPADLTARGVHFVLVDHNSLLPQFGPGAVDVIIDHHVDEGNHPSAQRLITTTGSCSSLVIKYFRRPWQDHISISDDKGQDAKLVDTGVATLLLAAMVIDTSGLRPGGKATRIDNESAAFLYPLTSLSAPSPFGSHPNIGTNPPIPLTKLTNDLTQAKFNVSHLSTPELLLRDYKEYVLPTSAKTYPTLRLGLSTVPLGLETWLDRDTHGWKPFLLAVDDYMEEKQLNILGILTTFRDDKDKSRREILLIVGPGKGLPEREEQKVIVELAKGMEESGEVLDLGAWGSKKGVKDFLEKGDGRVGRVWQQRNTKSTRKQVAPILVSAHT